MGDAEEANQLYEKTVSLNPAHVEDYYPLGAFILFELGHYAKAIALTQKCHNLPWVHIPAIFAATYFHFGDYDKMILYWEKYLQAYQKSIRYGDDFTLDEAVGWVTKVSPYKVENRMSDFLQYISKGTFNDNKQKTKDKPIVVKPSASINRFIKETDIWELSYDGQSIQLAEVKGFLDIQKLLANPMQSFHCAELMGSVLTATGEVLLDEKAKKAYQKKILDLRQDIETAENHNDFDRLSALEEEYEKMIHHLSESLGLKGKVRQAGNPVEKARSAVTWRIRNAIAKIEIVLPLLGKHLSNSIKTGTICSYTPEQELTWSTN